MRDTATLLFPEDFALVPPPPPPPLAPAAATITHADLATAYDAGHAAGERAGRDAEAADRGSRATGMLAVIAARLDGFHAAAADAADTNASALAHLLLDALGAAFPALRARHGEGELRRVIAAVAPALARESHVVLRVHPSLAGATAEALAALPPHAGPAPLIEACDQIAIGDAVILWDGGGAMRDSAAAWRAVADALRPFGLDAATPTQSSSGASNA